MGDENVTDNWSKDGTAWRVPLFGEAGDDGSISSTIRTSSPALLPGSRGAVSSG